MPLPRPASPRAAWRDLRTFLAHRSKHQLIAAFLAVAIPAGTLYIFALDSRTNLAPGPRVTYIDSWSADVSDDEVKARQAVHQERREAADAERRKRWKELGDRLGM